MQCKPNKTKQINMDTDFEKYKCKATKDGVTVNITLYDHDMVVAWWQAMELNGWTPTVIFVPKPKPIKLLTN